MLRGSTQVNHNLRWGGFHDGSDLPVLSLISASGTRVVVAEGRATRGGRIGVNRNGRHDGKRKSDDEQQFSHTSSVTARVRCQNEIHEVFRFQKTNSATIRLLARHEMPPSLENFGPRREENDIW
jgi:hypothetical protein